MWQAAVDWLIGQIEPKAEPLPAADEQPLPKLLHEVPPIRWGFLGTSVSATELAECLESTPDCRLVSVVSSDAAAAQDMRDRFGLVPRQVATADLSEVDVVYVSGPVAHRKADCLYALERGRHVVVEPPLALSEKEASEVVRLALLRQRLLVEAVPLKFSPSALKLEELLSEGAIGALKFIQASGSTGRGPDDGSGARPPPSRLPRLAGSQLSPPGGGRRRSADQWSHRAGALLPLGAFAVDFALLAVGGADEVSVAAVGDVSADFAVDHQVAMSLSFTGGQLASLSCSTSVDLPGGAQIYGSRGSIHVLPPFWCPHAFTVTTYPAQEAAPGSCAETQEYTFPARRTPGDDAEEDAADPDGSGNAQAAEWVAAAAPPRSMLGPDLVQKDLVWKSLMERAAPPRAGGGTQREALSAPSASPELARWRADVTHGGRTVDRSNAASPAAGENSFRGWMGGEMSSPSPPPAKAPPGGALWRADSQEFSFESPPGGGDGELAAAAPALVGDGEEAANWPAVGRTEGRRREGSREVEKMSSLQERDEVGGGRGEDCGAPHGDDLEPEGLHGAAGSPAHIVCLVEEVVHCIREGLVESPLMPPRESLQVLRILDRVRSHIGLTYPIEHKQHRIPSLSDWGSLNDL